MSPTVLPTIKAETGLKGAHVLAALLAFFGIVFAVNGVLVFEALKTHSGVVAQEPYRKGLAYNDRIAADGLQSALGWKADVGFGSAGQVALTMLDRDDKPLSGLLIAGALGLNPAQISLPNHRPATHQGGPRFLYVPVDCLQSLGQAKPHEPHWSNLMARAEVDSAYLYTPGADCDYRARLFSPTAGIPEDPATGSASAILAAQLLASGVIAAGITSLTLRQGYEMGRPSQIGLTIDASAQGLQAVRIKGSAVPISSGQIRRPSRRI